MAVEALCPTCGAVFNLSDEYVGKKVRCKKCEHAFTVAGPRGRQRDDDEAVQSDRAAIGSKRSSRDEDDDRPRRRPARAEAPTVSSAGSQAAFEAVPVRSEG